MANEEMDEGSEIDEPEEVEESPPPAPVATKPKVGVGAPSGGGTQAGPKRAARWQTKDAEDLWPEMLGRLAAGKRSASDIDARVIRIDPPPRTTLQTIRGNLLAGSSMMSPRDALVQQIDRIHMMSSPNGGPARYQIDFVWRVGSQLYGRAEIDRPSVAEIAALRSQGVAGPPQQPQWQQAPPAEYHPPPQAMPPAAIQAPQAAPPPGYYPPPQGYGAPMQQGPDPRDGVIQMLTDMLRQNGLQVPAGVAAPPQPQGPPAWWSQPPPWMQNQLPGGAGYGAPPNNQHQQERPQSGMRAMLAAKREQIDFMREMKQLKDELDSIFPDPARLASLGSPANPEEDETLGAPPDPNEALPYQLIDIPGADASAFVQRFARDKATGDVDWKHTALNNPKLAEEAFKLAGRFTETLGKLFKNVEAQSRQGAGVAAPPQQLPAGAPNGAAGGGWSEES